MKIKISLILFTLIMAAYGALAQTRSVTEAMAIAESFLSNPGGTALRSAAADKTLSLAYTSKNSLQSMPEKNNYYVFNRGDNNGFIIVSADERTIAVLGYSNEGNFDYDGLPPNLKGWLASYDEQIESLDDPQSTAPSAVALKQLEQPEVTTRFAASYEIDLKTKWNQYAPYNDLCPGSGNTKSLTGCVATTMAQIMYHHQWPAKGTGSHSYVPPATQYNYGTVTANFGDTNYDWANMLPTYTGDETAAQKNAVATLMYHCAIAANTSFGPGSSSANTDNLMDGMIKYFNYSDEMEYVPVTRVVRVSADWYNWFDLLKAEISANRPVVYMGMGSGTHIWVCYGYDSQNYFAMNWGWGGALDGYYWLTDLRPGDSYFNYAMTAVITGIMPNSPTGNEEVIVPEAQPALQTYATNDMLYVSGLTAGQPFSVFSITGAVVYQGVASDKTAFAGLPGRGVYIVRSADKVAKVVN